MNELPIYQCHKKVRAAKIADIGFILDGDSTAIMYLDGINNGLVVDIDYIKKHCPQNGGYYVVYDDGYESYSPAEAFENGYTKIS